MKVGVVIPFRNREPEDLVRLLQTLSAQTRLPDEVVVVNFGDFSSRLQELTFSFRYSCHHLPQPEIWSKSLALNQGARLLKEVDTALFTDADLLLAPNFIECGSSYFEDFPLSVMNCQCLDLAEGAIKPDTNVVQEFQSLLKQAVIRHEAEVGGCLWLPLKCVHELRGFDEEYKLWGCEDVDFKLRALWYGLRTFQLYPETAILHQWHSPTRKLQELETEEGRRFKQWYSKNWTHRDSRIKLWEENVFRFEDVNPQSWGLTSK
jgi:glycosyltransferase involved in cell wall biosynthesis